MVEPAKPRLSVLQRHNLCYGVYVCVYRLAALFHVCLPAFPFHDPDHHFEKASKTPVSCPNTQKDVSSICKPSISAAGGLRFSKTHSPLSVQTLSHGQWPESLIPTPLVVLVARRRTGGTASAGVSCLPPPISSKVIIFSWILGKRW